MSVKKGTKLFKRVAPEISGAYNTDYYGSLFLQEVGHHNPTIEQLNTAGWMPKVNTEYDQATHKLAEVLSDDGSVVGYAKIELTADEIAHRANDTLLSKRRFMIVTPWQFRKAINQLGRRGNVNSILVQADQDTKDGWEVATQFERLNPLITAFGAQLWPDDTDVELDNLFDLAKTL